MRVLAKETVSQSEMERRLVRYGELIPCGEAFIDRRTPGCQGNENFTIIGPGVAEAPDQHVHITIPHGFNIGGARQHPGTSNSQHSHEKEEVFVVHRGTFKFHLGPNKEDGGVVLQPGDTISVPTRVFRGFQNVGDTPGYLFAVLGGDDPGRVTWAPYVLEAARGTGLVLLEDGRLIDLTSGQHVPDDALVAQPLTAAELCAFQRLRAEDAGFCVVREGDLRPDRGSPLAGSGVDEIAVIGPLSEPENIGPAPICWRHGFHLRRVLLAPDTAIPPHARTEVEVLFINRGALTVEWPEGSVRLDEGDHLTLPAGIARRWHNDSPRRTDVVVVRGGNEPAAPLWDTM